MLLDSADSTLNDESRQLWLNSNMFNSMLSRDCGRISDEAIEVLKLPTMLVTEAQQRGNT